MRRVKIDMLGICVLFFVLVFFAVALVQCEQARKRMQPDFNLCPLCGE
jgi:hypothetical protein